MLTLREAILAGHGCLDVMFNNAVARAGGELDETTPANWDAPMRLKYTGLFPTCRIFSEPMRECGSGSIVNIASIYGMVGPAFSIYGGTQVVTGRRSEA